jgi:hypothetical protein
MKINAEHVSRVVALVVANLPDGFSERKRVLVTLHTMLPRDHADRDKLGQMVASMNHIERLQSSLSLHIRPAGDGDGKGNGQ